MDKPLITTYLQFGDLASYLMLEPLKQLQADIGVDIGFVPMLSTLGDVSGSNVKQGDEDPLATYKARRKEARRRAANRERERQCGMLGLSVEQGCRNINPLALSLGLAWANHLADSAAIWRFVEIAFRKTFHDMADVESFDGVERLLEQAGIPVDRFSEAFMAEAGSLQDSQDDLLEKGILSSPTFEVDGEVFQGREHLPLIRWLLSGREGPPPV